MSKKEAIMRATIEIIAEDGVMHATIGNILKKAKTGYGTLYNYFDSKEDLFLAVYLDILNGITRFIQSQMTESIDLKDTLEQMIQYYTIYCLNHIKDFSALESMRHLPDLCHRAKKSEAKEDNFFELIEACEETQVIKKRKPAYNMTLLTGMVAAFVNYYNSNQLNAEPDAIEDFVLSCMKALG